MSVFQDNLNVLKIYQPKIWSQMKSLDSARFNRPMDLSYPLSGLAFDPLCSELDDAIGIHVYGSGNADVLRLLLKRLKPGLLLNIYDSSIDQLGQLLYHHDLSDFISSYGVRWYLGSYEELKGHLDSVLLESQDRLGWLWLNLSEPSLGDDFQTYFQACAQRWLHKNNASDSPLKSVYHSLTPEITQATLAYKFTCQQGCASCCEANTGYYLFLNPLEWAELYQSLWALPEADRKEIYHKSVHELSQGLDFSLDILFFLDTQPERLNSADVQREVLQMACDLPRQSCLFLNQQKSCQLYGGRPLACRLYGNSHFAYQRPFTCDLDYAYLEQTLLDEGQQTHLVDSELWRQKTWALHQNMNYCQILNLWIFTHLDFDSQDFIPQARLDYQQFQALVRDEALLDDKISALEDSIK